MQAMWRLKFYITYALTFFFGTIISQAACGVLGDWLRGQ